MTRTLPLLALFAAMLAAGPALAQGMSYGRAPKIEADPTLPGRSGVDSKIGTKIPLDLTFYDHLNRPVTLRDVTSGKPTIFILAYYSCPKLCTEVLNGLVGEMRKMARDGYVVGRDFHVVTVSINPLDAPAFAFKKRRSYLDELDRRPDEEPGWSFLTAGHGQGTNVVEAYRNIQLLADSVGFRYVADNQKQYDDVASFPEVQREAKLDKAVHKTKDFVHPSTVMVVTADGTVILSQSNYCGVRAVQGKHRGFVIDFVRDARSGGCAAGVPPDYLGFRLVRTVS